MGWKKAAFWTLMCGLKQVAGHRSVHFWKAVRLQVYLQPLVEGDAERCRPSEKQPQGTGTWGLSQRGQHGAGGRGLKRRRSLAPRRSHETASETDSVPPRACCSHGGSVATWGWSPGPVMASPCPC